MKIKQFKEQSREALLFGVILIIALVHGICHVFIVPPWEHYDEPGHFEYVWLIANNRMLPDSQDHSWELRREIMKSMILNDFYARRNYQVPDIDAEELTIGGNALGKSPTYYILASIPLIMFPSDDVTIDLYKARLVSLLLYLIIVLIGWFVARELTPSGHPLRFFLPFTLATLPSFTNHMTAVNNDVLATTVFSFFLLGGVRLMRRGITLPNLIWVLGAAAACLWAKNTVAFAIPLLIIALAFHLLDKYTSPIIAWSSLIAGTIIGLAIVITWGDSAYWHRGTSQATTTRIYNPQTPLGEYNIQLEISRGVFRNDLVPAYQPLPKSKVVELGGKHVTLGAWIWSSEPINVRTPILGINDETWFKSVKVGRNPRFYSFRVKVPDNVYRIWVTLDPSRDANGTDADVIVNFDGLILTEGKFPLDQTPSYKNINGEQGIWGGQPFVNMLRNPSAEHAWPLIRPGIDQKITPLLGSKLYPAFSFHFLIDWKGLSWYYLVESRHLFESFWARFGWGEVILLGNKPYRLLAILTLAGISGAIWSFIKLVNGDLWKEMASIVILFGFAMLFSWLITFLRGIIFIPSTHLWLPVARYAFPAIIPTLLLLNVGWLQWFEYAERWSRIKSYYKYVVLAIFFVGLDIFSLISLVNFYHG